jgi:hypothetical protein
MKWQAVLITQGVRLKQTEEAVEEGFSGRYKH